MLACEGSMFKSKFANALTVMMVGALGVASVEQKLAVGYGGEAGEMDPAIRDLVRRRCRDAFVVTRNEASRALLTELGIEAATGTDTAWTFEPAPREVGEAVLRRAGWDGTTPVLALCPINAYWWPVKPRVGRALELAVSGVEDDAHYGSVYFHRDDAETDARQRRYIDALAGAVRAFRARHAVFPVLIGSEQLDRRACEALDEALGGGHPVIVSDAHDMYEMVSVMRCASLMLSSRYHAIVTSMPAGVPSAGVTMDERIRNLMADRGQPELSIDVDAPDLEARCLAALEHLWAEPEAVRAAIERSVADHLERMGSMGALLIDRVRAAHPELPLRPGLGAGGDPWAHLPALSPSLRALVERSRA